MTEVDFYFEIQQSEKNSVVDLNHFVGRHDKTICVYSTSHLKFLNPEAAPLGGAGRRADVWHERRSVPKASTRKV